MNIQNIFLPISGTAIGTGNHTVSMTLLCATSGGVVIPLTCNSEGYLISTSGAL